MHNNGDFSLHTANGNKVWSLSTASAHRHNNHGVGLLTQTDPRWAHQWIGGRPFGPVGCVPTAFAMAAQSYGVWVDPPTVGVQMHQHSDFNRGHDGAGSKSIVSAAKQNSLMVTPLHSPNAISKALRNNQPVIGLVRGPGQITRPGSTHAIVLTGYSGGNTTLLNPWGGIPNQTWSVTTLWHWQSHDPLDSNAGALFWAIG
nr:C39 family peptidase [Leucobacter exalbidus]